jgi:5-hydroxyisourate hydrolase
MVTSAPGQRRHAGGFGNGDPMGRLTTHILDTARGVPAAGIEVRLFALGDERSLRATAVTDADGRTGRPLLEGDALGTGTYELEFDVGEYFCAHGGDSAGPAFLGTVVVRFSMSAGEHYHVPLLVSPWSYTTYRGS